MNAESVFFFNLEFFFFFCKFGTKDLFPIKRRKKPNLNRRKRTPDGEVIDGQSWLIGGQTYRLKTIQTTCRMDHSYDHSADVMMTSSDDVMMTSVPRQQKKKRFILI